MRHTLNDFKKYLEQNGQTPSNIYATTEICNLIKTERKKYAAIIPCENSINFVIAYKFQSMKKPIIEKTERNLQKAIDDINYLFKI